MKRISKLIKISSLCLAMLVTTAFGVWTFGLASVFAAGGNEPKEPDRTPATHTYDTQGYGAAHTDINEPGYNRYIMSVVSGVRSGDCVKSIVLKYYSSPSDKNFHNLNVQILQPTKVTGYDPENQNAWYENPDSYMGTRQATYTAYATRHGRNNPGFWGGTTYSTMDEQGNLITGYRWFNKYEAYVDLLMSSHNETPSLEDKIAQPSFGSYTTDTVMFTFEYNFYELDSVTFYLESEGVDSWSVESWALYSVNEDTIRGINNYAFFTDSMQLDFDGKLLYQSDHLADAFGFKDAGALTFGYDDPSGSNREKKNSIGGSLYYYYFHSPSGSASTMESSRRIYNFSINLSDVYDAGIEAFNKNPVTGEVNIFECLTAQIRYIDEYDSVKEVIMPVISNAIMEYAMPMNEFIDLEPDLEEASERDSILLKDCPKMVKIINKDYLSYAQQGESIIFSVEFPSIKKLESITLNYENKADKFDSINIEDITVYNNWGNNTYPRRNYYGDLSGGLAISPSIAGSTLLYRTDPVSGGTILDNTSGNVKFDFYDPDDVEIMEKDYSETYLISITTSDVNFADTTADATVSFDYLCYDGSKGSSLEYNLRDLALNYYGYNPGYDVSTGEIVDGNYNWCLSRGGTIKFLVDLKNVERFTAINFHVSEKSDDEWQVSGIQIRKVESVGRRIIYAVDEEDESVFGGVKINRTYDREVVLGDVSYFADDIAILIQGGGTATLNLETEYINTEVVKRDYSEYYYSMDYETAMSDLHFDEAAYNYEVRVHVEKESVAGTRDDDTGSDNLFYFQLIFQNGTSGYVQANAQLKADGFRSGEVASFNIGLNENYGDITAVKIIPDDVTEDADPLDKLCIEYIEIIKKNVDTADKRYVCDNVGWVNVDYRDTQESITTQSRSEAELATVCPVTSSAYMLEMEVAIAIDSYTDKYGVTTDQFEGNMTATVVYYNSAGERKYLRDIEVVAAMYDYVNKAPVADETYGYMSNPLFMFRENHIDRFIIDINDAMYIESISLTGYPTKDVELPIAGISLKILKSEGTLIINKEGDYQRIYEVDPVLLTDQIPGRNLPQRFVFHGGTKNNKNDVVTYTFNFGDNTIPKFDDDTNFESLISRVPESANDTLNIYIYMEEGVKDQVEGGYHIEAKANYASLADNYNYVSKCTEFKTTYDNGRVVYYATGLSATNMSVLTNLNVQAADAIGRTDILADYAIVQRVRNGVVINTFKILFGSHIVSKTGGINMQGKTSSDALGFRQVVNIALGEGTPATKLVEEKYDIALALRYTSTSGDSKTVYTSPYVFATDSGTTNIHEGSMVSFSFNEAYIKEIVGVDILTSNGVKAVVDGASIVTYNVGSDGAAFETGRYSIGKETSINGKLQHIDVTNKSSSSGKTLKKVNFSFKTMDRYSEIDSGGVAPIRLEISYKNVNNEIKMVAIKDIRTYSGSNSDFSSGQTANISFFLEGIKSINYIRVLPYDTDDSNIASWNLESISFQIDGIDDTSTHTIPANRIVELTSHSTKEEEDACVFNLSTIR